MRCVYSCYFCIFNLILIPQCRAKTLQKKLTKSGKNWTPYAKTSTIGMNKIKEEKPLTPSMLKLKDSLLKLYTIFYKGRSAQRYWDDGK
jgi:hypothetical protein